MAWVTVSIRKMGGEKTRKALDLLQKRTDHPKEATTKIGMLMLRSIDTNFRRGGRPAWKPLSNVTISRRRKGKTVGTPKPLLDTGIMRGSVVFHASDNDCKLGTPLRRAIVHQYGGISIIPKHKEKVKAHKRKGYKIKAHIRLIKEKKLKVPARPFVVAQKEDIRRIAKIIKEFIARGK